jgi:hypothetical protein
LPYFRIGRETLLEFGTEISSHGRGVVFPASYATHDPFRCPLSRSDVALDGKYAQFRQCG